MAGSSKQTSKVISGNTRRRASFSSFSHSLAFATCFQTASSALIPLLGAAEDGAEQKEFSGTSII